jgi:hypothetical protein
VGIVGGWGASIIFDNVEGQTDGNRRGVLPFGAGLLAGAAMTIAKPGALARLIGLSGRPAGMRADPLSYLREADRALAAGDIDRAHSMIAQAYRAFDAREAPPERD